MDANRNIFPNEWRKEGRTCLRKTLGWGRKDMVEPRVRTCNVKTALPSLTFSLYVADSCLLDQSHNNLAVHLRNRPILSAFEVLLSTSQSLQCQQSTSPTFKSDLLFCRVRRHGCFGSDLSSSNQRDLARPIDDPVSAAGSFQRRQHHGSTL